MRRTITQIFYKINYYRAHKFSKINGRSLKDISVKVNLRARRLKLKGELGYREKNHCHYFINLKRKTINTTIAIYKVAKI